MDPFSRFFFLIPLALFIVAVNGSEKDIITTTCAMSTYKELCIKSLQSGPANEQTDLSGLATIAIKAAIRRATKTSKQVNELLNAATDPFEQEVLKECAENYMDAVDQLDDSLAALDSKGYDDVKAWVQAAMTDADSCEDGFSDKPGYVSILSKRNTNFSHLCSNVLAIVNLLSGV
ncbi:hypothetical protein GIB67_003819 [Kingdonia uniflora]|uniref:Pectinesterase inhibitor domain-containing protein n=1 Tax=Kingdonia uniflora TaxID=39325 RepID=A0A7J7P3S7_9MAGN|nr:hypothetical protein GIB67_003819 [Kingdonia uniflora]